MAPWVSARSNQIAASAASPLPDQAALHGLGVALLPDYLALVTELRMNITSGLALGGVGQRKLERYGAAFLRVDGSEGAETATGGNGVTGHDETSEDASNTWAGGIHDPGTGAASTAASAPIFTSAEISPPSTAATTRAFRRGTQRPLSGAGRSFSVILSPSGPMTNWASWGNPSMP